MGRWCLSWQAWGEVKTKGFLLLVLNPPFWPATSKVVQVLVKRKCYRCHSVYKCTQPASESNWWVCGGSPQKKTTVKTAAWVCAGERRKEWSWSKCCLTISRESNGKPSTMLNPRKRGAMWPEGLFKVLEESFRSLALMYLGCELAHTKPGVCQLVPYLCPQRSILEETCKDINIQGKCSLSILKPVFIK